MKLTPNCWLGENTYMSCKVTINPVYLLSFKNAHVLIVHQIKPEASDDYAGLVSERYNKIANEWENQVNLVGSWQTLVGELDQAVHIWEYRGYPGYHHTMNRLRSSEEHRQFERKLAPMLRGRRNEICLEFAFWLTSPPSERGKVYELRTYELKVFFLVGIMSKEIIIAYSPVVCWIGSNIGKRV